MRISSKCSLALHILLLLAVYKHDKLTSEIMASSTGCNPAMIRDMMKTLREAGLIETTRGTGGSRLIKDPKDITIWTVYCAADPDSFQNCIALHKNPYEGCPVGRCITPVLSRPYGNIKNAIREAMQAETLQGIIDDYYAMTDKPTH